MNTRFLFSLAVIGCSLYANTDTASISGTLTDASGALVNGGKVSLHQVAGSALLTSVSDRAGRFAFEDITPGEYLLDASGAGLTSIEPANLSLGAGDHRELTVQLAVSAVRTQITVTGANAPQSTDQVSKAIDVVDVVEARQRGIFSVPDALRFVPGLRVSTRGSPGAFTTIQTRGLRASDTAVLIDGFRFRDPTGTQGDASAYLGDLLLVDIGRIEVLRGSGSSLYGTNSMSGTINIISEQGSGPMHGELDVQGGGLGTFEGVAQVAGGALHNRLSYSAGIVHLNVTEGVADAGAVRNWSGQESLTYALTSKMRVGANLFVNSGFLQENVSPAPSDSAPASGIIPAIGGVTFIPSLGDPDAGRYSHFLNSLYRFEHEVTPRFSYRLAYGLVSAVRDNRDGPGGPGFYQPAFNTSDKYNGRIDTFQARVNYLLGPHQVLTAGYEFEREHYLNLTTDQNPDPAQRAYYKTDAQQRSNAVFAQDEIRLLGGRVQVLLSGRFTQASIDQPKLTGGLSPYLGIKLPAPPAAYTGDASLAYFLHSTATKLRAHTGNSFRLPSLYERFGGYLYQGYDFAYGDPRLSPERAISVDLGFDQYVFGERLKISSTYFYSHLQQVVGFLSFPPGYVDPYGRSGGYYNRGGGISRGVELSGEFRPTRKTNIFASYTYTNARDKTPQYYTGMPVAPLQSPRILPNAVTLVATQQIGKRIDVGLDFDGGSDYLYPLYGYAYKFAGPRQLGLSGGYSLPLSDRVTARIYTRISNTLDQNLYEDGFLTPRRWAVAGVRVSF